MARAVVLGAHGGRLNDVREAALTLFAANGYSGTSMADIARELDLGAPSLYNHISSKVSLLYDVCISTLGALLALQQEAMAANDASTQLRMATKSLVSYSATHPREITTVAREFIHLDGDARQEVLGLHHQYERRFRDLIEEGRACGAFATQRPQLASYAIIEMGLAAAQW